MLPSTLIASGLKVRGRLAPTPSGDMHLGNARTALLAWLSIRSQGGALVVRIEDLDAARATVTAARGLLRDLDRLDLTWDEGPGKDGGRGPYHQSERTAFYTEAARRLLRAGNAFLCACSRTDVARAALAPHPGEDGPRYPGTCRDLDPGTIVSRARALGRSPVVRFRGFSAPISWDDAVAGPQQAEGVDDFVLRRSDGTASYQLAVVIDDARMDISEVVRGDDLLTSTPRQLALYRALGLRPPRFAHVPLLLAPGGERLAKRNRPASVDSLLSAGVPGPVLIGALAASAGLCAPGVSVRPLDLVGAFTWGRVARSPVEIDAAALLAKVRCGLTSHLGSSKTAGP